MSRVVIIDYGSGNLHSAVKAFERAANEASSGDEIALSSDPRVVENADHVVLPGVGAFADCGEGLAAVPGMLDALNEAVQVKCRPFLGICVGLQLLFSEGQENGFYPGLGLIEGSVVRFGSPILNNPAHF